MKLPSTEMYFEDNSLIIVFSHKRKIIHRKENNLSTGSNQSHQSFDFFNFLDFFQNPFIQIVN